MLINVSEPNRPATFKETALIGLALAILLAIAFAPFLFGPYTLLNSSRDTPSLYDSGAWEAPDYGIFYEKTLDPSSGEQNEPWFELEHNEWLGFHEAPFWNPYQAYGTPLAAAMQPQPFHPLSWIVEAKPSPRRYDVFIVVRLFVAGLFAAMYIRLFCGNGAALMAGIAASFGGYFLLFYSMPHLSVETLLPALLWALEFLLRRPTLRRAAYLAIVIALIVLGGMPESAALALTCVAGYFLLRVTSLTKRWVAFGFAVTGTLLGIAAGGVVLLPFAEYVANSYNTHQPQFLGGGFTGLQADSVQFFARYMITELAPLAFGPPWNSITADGGFAGLRGFSGMVIFFGAIIAVMGVFRASGRGVAQPTLYFAAVVIVCELKRFGIPLVNWIGALPVYRLIVFNKYDEAIVTTCMALLCGFGFAALFERRVLRNSMLAAAGSAIAILSLLYYSTLHLVPSDTLRARDFYDAIALAVGCLVIAAGGAWLWLLPGERMRRGGLALLTFALVLESTANYYLPLFILLNKPTPAHLNAYAGAPYITFLKKEIATSATRILGYPVELFPNWASAYGLDDPRSIDAIFARDYIAWMAAFNPGNAANPNDHNTSINVTSFSDPAFLRWMTLSSIGYVIVPNHLAVSSHDSAFLDGLMSANRATITKDLVGHVSTGPYLVAGRTENALYEEPSNTLDAPTTIPREMPFFTVDLALDPRAYSGPPCGAPLHFRLSLLDATKRTVLSTALYTIDPLRRFNERTWIAKTLDLRRFSGKPVVMRFQTLDLGSNICKAWPLWGEPRFAARPAERFEPTGERYSLAYAADTNIYRFKGALPRISIFHDVKPVVDEATALTMLHDGAVNVAHTALVEGRLDVGPAAGPESAIIDRRTSSLFEAHVTLSAPGLVMLNDTYYPGWSATIDGKSTPILRTDFLFRGLAVPAGAHHIVFAYRSLAVTAGTALTAAALLGVLAALIYSPRRRLGRPRFPSASGDPIIETPLVARSYKPAARLG